ncbi:histidinol dehydrogenase [Listeria goaensis]|uniref:histidinol dehydrogenase n=1 Tax=Listeria goaensis TaxID=1649188 RepID=UPI000B5929B9|nr:histidinol dehydrogenase [Listeria goaensis]
MKRLTGNVATILKQLEVREQTHADVGDAVRKIISAVKEDGDAALVRLTKEFDAVDLTAFRVSQAEIDAAYESVPASLIRALETARKNISDYHEKQKRSGFLDSEKDGVVRGMRVTPIDSVGIYVPGGTASYPSSVLMNAIPAKVAGVEKIVMVTPPDVDLNPAVLAAAKIAGVDEVFTIGGAQAIAALAYGTDSIPRVAKIVGPGNIFVATAKREVFGQVGIDMIAGPSEILILADETANPAFIAADLLSQAEHDELARVTLVTTSNALIQATEDELLRQVQSLSRKTICEVALQNGHFILAESTADMFAIANEIAPEHLEIQMENPLLYLPQIKNAGSIFLGAHATEPLGDYIAGPNHVIPTAGTAKFSSPLGVDDFTKRSSFILYSENALKDAARDVIELAESEGLTAHARAIQIRLEERQDENF